jgi:hypothetical protein
MRAFVLLAFVVFGATSNAWAQVVRVIGRVEIDSQTDEKTKKEYFLYSIKGGDDYMMIKVSKEWAAKSELVSHDLSVTLNKAVARGRTHCTGSRLALTSCRRWATPRCSS